MCEQEEQQVFNGLMISQSPFNSVDAQFKSRKMKGKKNHCNLVDLVMALKSNSYGV